MEKKTIVEVEDKEIAIKSSNGVLAVVPKAKAKWVKEMIAKGEHAQIDDFISKLPRL